MYVTEAPTLTLLNITFFCHCAIHETADKLCFCTARQNTFLRDKRIFSYQKMINDTTLKKKGQIDEKTLKNVANHKWNSLYRNK